MTRTQPTSTHSTSDVTLFQTAAPTHARASARVTPEGSTTVVHAAGEFDVSSAPILAAALRSASHRRKDVVIDMSAVTFIDASAVAELVAATASAVSLGATLAIIEAGAPVSRVLSLVGLTHMMRG